MKLGIDKLWHNIFSRTDGGHFVMVTEMVKCALAICHLNANVERSFGTNKIMLRKQNMSLSEETITGLSVIKAAVDWIC